MKNAANSGRDFARVPREQASFQIYWSPADKWNTALIYNVVGPRFNAVNNVQELNSYHQVDCNVSYDICQYCTVFGRAENLVGYRYQTAMGYPALGRTFYGGFELKY